MNNAKYENALRELNSKRDALISQKNSKNDEFKEIKIYIRKLYEHKQLPLKNKNGFKVKKRSDKQIN